MNTFGRVLTAMVTSFNEDGSVNFDNTLAIANYLLDHGSDGLIVCGTTGENPTISLEDKIKLFTLIGKECAHKGSIIANVGNNNTALSAKVAKEVGAIPGISGLLVVVPYYNKPNQKGQYLHFKTIAEATTKPIIVYNVPGRVGTSISPAIIAQLHKEYPHICAVKEASGNVNNASELYSLLGDSDFMIYSGDDGLTLPILSVGGVGVISVASHIVGAQMNAMIQAYEAGKVQEAKNLQRTLWNVMNAMFVTTNPIPVKYAARQIGLPVGSFNLPMCEPSESEARVIDEAIASFK